MAKRVIAVGRPLAEMVKGSFEYAVDEVARAFRNQFGYGTDSLPRMEDGHEYWPVETMPDALIVREYGSQDEGPDEFYRAAYTKAADGTITFAARDAWEPVELTYQPQTPTPEQPPMAEASQDGPLRAGPPQQAPTQRRRLEERVEPRAELEEATGANGNTRRIRIKGLLQAGVVNGNGRRYSADVLRAAVDRWRSHLHESAGRGRLQILTGEAEHPGDKGNRGARFLETVVKWTDVEFDGQDVDVAGELILTTKGRDVATLMESGVHPGGSVRGFYESKPVKEGGLAVEVVTWCEITGADLVGYPSFENAADLLESKGAGASPDPTGEDEMTAEQLAEMLRANPGLVKGIVAEDIQKMSDDQRKVLEEALRKALGIAPDADLAKELQEAMAAKRELAEQTKAKRIAEAVTAAVKDLPYAKDLNAQFQAELSESVTDVEQVATRASSLRKRYDVMVAAARLGAMGRDVQVLGPVLERETGIPEYARASHDFTESMIERGIASRRNLAQPRTVNETVAARVLKRFDQAYKLPLMREARMLEETILSSDLNLPYSVSRAILAEVWPQLVATSIFDVDTTEQSPTRVYYEDYQDVSGKHVVITDDGITSSFDVWVALTHAMIQPGTVVVTPHGGTPTYVEGTDYIIDYMDGKIMVLSTGGISDSTDTHVDYHYDSVREGENMEIQRAKMVLGYGTLDCKADRLATQITSEAVVFSRSQMGWDVTARTLAGLVAELRREIDTVLMYNALGQALKLASNSGGTYTASTDPLIDLVSYIGVARGKVAGRYFQPEWILMSDVSSDSLSNWEGFSASGKRPDSDLNANGYVGRLKGLPVFVSTEFSDAYALVGNKQLLHYRIFLPMTLKGPFPSYGTNRLLIAADQWYAEQYDGWLSPVAGKGSYVKIA